jgi:phage/plasmid-associated DNA primase
VIASGDEEIYNYIMAWMARIVQDPGGKRPGVTLVLRGKQGTGKGCFVNNFGKIFGKHFIQITNQQQLIGRFNFHMKDALFMFVDEGTWGGNREAEGVLKGLITEETLMCEPKGKDPFTIKNHMNIVIASNNEWVVPAGLEERRFFVLDVSDEHIQDTEYFKRLYDQMDNGGREAMLYDLLRLDISDVDLRSFPRTGALLDQIFQTMSTVRKFWLDRLRNGQIDSTANWIESYETRKFYEDYITFAKNIGDRYPLPQNSFGVELRKVCPSITRKKDTVYGRQEWCYFFPPLHQCRNYFESLVNIPIPWDDDTTVKDPDGYSGQF